MRRAAIVVISVVTSCVNGRQDDTRDTTTHLAIAAPTTRRWCWDSVEVRALACSQQTARRSGETLFVRLVNGREVPFVDDRVSDNQGGYHYVGRITRPPLQVVQEYGHETPPSWLFVSEQTGRSAVANDQPVMSPDSTRFATAAEPDWNNCSERDHPSLDVWRFTDTLPLLEWRLDPWDCHRQVGWGPTHPRWHGPDTLEFVRNEQIVRDTAAKAPAVVDYRESHAMAVRGRGGWRVISR
jgi:hypothetical protein